MHTVDPKQTNKKVGATQLFQTQWNTYAIRTEVHKAMLSGAGELLPCLVQGLSSPDQTRNDLWEKATGSRWAKAEGYQELLTPLEEFAHWERWEVWADRDPIKQHIRPLPSSNARNFEPKWRNPNFWDASRMMKKQAEPGRHSGLHSKSADCT